MDRAALRGIALLGGMAAFGASGLSLALLGLGVPYLVAALVAASWAGLLIYAVGRWALARARPPARPEERPRGERAALLRHELRSALLPALMVSDRLLRSDDPAIRRAGEAVVRSVERATELIVKDKNAETAADAATPPV